MRRFLPVLAAAALAAIPAGTARAQSADIETLAAARGIALPQAYYERVRRDPDFFEFRHPRRVDLSGRAGVSGGARAAVLPSRGEMRMAVVMALFSDSPEPPLASTTTHQQLFGSNPLGNLTELYREMSGNRVSVTGTVFPWVRTVTTRDAVVGTTFGLGGGTQLGPYMLDALAKVDATVNFGQYDNDGPDGMPNSGDDDGLVDITVFQYAETAASCGGAGYGPWPHRSSVRNWTEGNGPWMTNDLRPNGQPIGVDDYIMQSVLDCNGAPQSIATIAHETGHAFGLPDYYHAVDGILPSQRRWVMGCFALMAAGSWGCGDGSQFGGVQRPSHMGAYEKRILGWSDEVAAADATAAQLFTLPPVQSSGRTLRVPLRGVQEYLLLEYRPNTGFDSGLPVGGVLMYHVEPARPLRPCPTCPRIYHVSLVESDGDGALLRTATEGGNRGVAGDVFTGVRVLNDATTPSLRLNSGEPSNLALKITVAGGQAQIGIFRRTVFATDRLLGPYLGTPALTDAEQSAADAFGNGNGSFDLGDVRIHLRANPAG